MLLAGDFWIFLCTGFVAQLIGSLLGMGYGMVSSAVLLTLGIAPALASASANTASFVTTTVASWFHHKEGNVDKKTLLYLAVPGVIGSVFGALFVSHAPIQFIKPFIGTYLVVVSLIIIRKSFVKYEAQDVPVSHLVPLGLIGGAFGSIGGGGWGPIVNGHLVANGHSPRHSIGSSNAAKCFTTFAAAATFAIVLKTCNVAAVVGLMLGGLVAAPMAAWACKRMPQKALMVSMAVLLVFISGKILHESFYSAKPAIALKSILR
jgi:uncharacterized membrane protein YfcA